MFVHIFLNERMDIIKKFKLVILKLNKKQKILYKEEQRRPIMKNNIKYFSS